MEAGPESQVTASNGTKSKRFATAQPRLMKELQQRMLPHTTTPDSQHTSSDDQENRRTEIIMLSAMTTLLAKHAALEVTTAKQHAELMGMMEANKKEEHDFLNRSARQ
ncbi:hypothetical protein ABBQ32_008856 [Trebouxia sp. C0010 RCD-2024]